jgi:xanthine dehydrogenase small subunit
MRDEVILLLNGRERRVRGSDAFLTLSAWLRQKEHAVGTKIVCEEGDCGACTVLVGRSDGELIRYQTVNSCIQLLAQFDATHVVTVEGLALDGELSVMQQSMVDHHGAQCGFCTPGFVVAMSALYEEKSDWSEGEVKRCLTGNLCRCTGYEPIIKAAMAACGQAGPHLSDLYPAAAVRAVIEEPGRESLQLEDAAGRRYFAPSSLEEALALKSEHGDLVILQGATDVGVLINKRSFAPPFFMTLARVPGLDQLEISDGTMTIGATVSLTRLERATESLVPELHRMLEIFGSPQIRNAGTLAGNIANGSPIADTLPFLFVTGARLEVASTRGERTVEINSLYRGYKSLALEPDELITRIIVPLPRPDEILKLYKVSRRRDLDISTFTAAFLLKLDGKMISSVRIAYGGVGPTVLRLPRTEAVLEGSTISEETFQHAGEVARSEIAPISDVRGSAEFRLQLAGNILMKLQTELTR